MHVRSGKRTGLIVRSSCSAYAEMVKETKEVADLDKDIRELELELARLRSKYPLEDVSDPRFPTSWSRLGYYHSPQFVLTHLGSSITFSVHPQRITTEQAETILDNQIVEMQNLEEEKKAVSAQVDEVREELARTAKEVQRMGRERDREEARAKEAREGAEKGDRSVDELCRWSVACGRVRHFFSAAVINKTSSLFQVHLGHLCLQGSERDQEHATLVRYRHLARIHPRSRFEG